MGSGEAVRQVAVVAGRRPEQEVGHLRTCAPRKARTWCAGCSTTADVLRRELPARHPRAVGAVPRGALEDQPAADHHPGDRLRPDRPVRAAGRLSVPSARRWAASATSPASRTSRRPGRDLARRLARRDVRLPRHAGRGAQRAAHRPRPGRRLGDLRGGAGHDGIADAGMADRRIPTRTHRRRAAERLAQQRLSHQRRRAGARSPPTRTRCSGGWPTSWAGRSWPPTSATPRTARAART